MLSFPNAKINIGLNIVERRPDHFHNIETIFYPLPVTDILEIIEDGERKGNKSEIITTGIDIAGPPDNNLCIKAYKLLDKSFHLPPVQIHLHKIIPTGAGLGGGSSDGAFTLTLLDRLFALNLTSEQLCNYAAELGSDCPFFIENKPAFGTQKGNALNNITLDLGGYYFVLVKPSISIGTSGAYRGVKPRKPEESVDTLVNLPINQWKYKVFNDFENSIFPDYPIIKEIKDGLYEAGALYACMTGSGSAVYGIFEGEVDFSTNKKQEFCWAGYL